VFLDENSLFNFAKESELWLATDDRLGETAQMAGFESMQQMIIVLI
jgi:hypothetical protein